MTHGIPHILVIDDHKSIREPIAEYLKKNGMRSSVAANGKQAYEVLKTSSIDLVVLDILMPGETGLEVCRRIRETRDTPVILLTAVSDETDRIIGLEMGADDYLTKPFNPRELLARIRSVLRRTESLPKQYSELGQGFVQFDGWQLNLDKQTIGPIGDTDHKIELSTAEFRLLSMFLTHPNIVLSREQLLDHISHRNWNAFDRSIDNQISRLRRKLEVNPKDPQIIKTVWGGGYMFISDVIRL